MATLSLDELKAENSAAENDNDTAPQADELENDAGEVKEETDETQLDAESDEDETEQTKTEDWRNPDGHTSDEKLFTGRDIKAAKTKLRARLDRQHGSEVDELKARISDLEKPNSNGTPAALSKPTREQFYDTDDPDEAYVDALTDYKISVANANQQAQNASTETSRKQADQLTVINKGVDAHYLRAAELSEKSGISAEVYQSSDLVVRQMIDELYPNAGDAITDALISKLGDGSEKVLYNLGVNKTRLNELREHLVDDPSGVGAAMYLGSLRSTLTNPRKRKTNAPKPAPNISGDKTSNSQHRALLNKYTSAHKSGDVQAAFNAKREAKKQGADTSTW